MEGIRAVAFDFDETLSDWPAAVARAVSVIATESPLDSQRDFKERFLRSAGELYPSRTPGPLYFEVHRVFEAVVGDVFDSQALAARFRSLLEPVAFSDVHQTLSVLAARFRLAILSNNPYAPEGVRLLGLDRFFWNVTARDETSGVAKPHPDAFNSLVRTLNLRPEEVAFVGDSISDDVEGALASGLVAVWLDRFASPQAAPAGAHRIGSLAELPPLLERI